MSSREDYEYVSRALAFRHGDGFERWEREFRSFDEAEMQAEHGHSGRTRQEVLDEYRADRAAWESARRWLDRQENRR